MLLFVDTETTGTWHLNHRNDDPRQPHLVQLAAILCTPQGATRQYLNATIRPDGYEIPDQATAIHGITTEYATSFGEPLSEVMARLLNMIDQANELEQGMIIAHNVTFDINVLSAALIRCNQNPAKIIALKPFCTMRSLTDHIKLPSKYAGKHKWPTLDEAWHYTHPDAPIEERHTAMGDALLCREIYRVGRERQWW